jgi:hypothetical protein
MPDGMADSAYATLKRHVTSHPLQPELYRKTNTPSPMPGKSDTQDLKGAVRKLLQRSAELREGLKEVLERVEKLDADVTKVTRHPPDTENQKTSEKE